jgi:hypothetical protein
MEPILRNVHRPVPDLLAKVGLPSGATDGQTKQPCCRFRVCGIIFLIVLLLALVAGLIVWTAREEHEHFPESDAALQLFDSQRIVLSSTLAIPVQGDADVVLIVVRNNGPDEIIDIVVNVELTSAAARRRSPVSLVVTCPPLYVDNIVASLASHKHTTCRALYTLTGADIINGNVLYTDSSGTGTAIDGTTMTVIASPGMSKLELNNLEIPEGSVFGIPGPAAPVNVVTGFCSDIPPHTTLSCGPANELQILFCDFSSNASQVGHLYMCVGGTWTFFGSVSMQGNSTAGPPGIGIYSATCAGGPPPTSVTGPAYTCNSAFNLNMVLCGMSSTNGNMGIIYACMCSPGCSWVEVGNLASSLTWINGYGSPLSINTTHDGWTDIASVVLPATGTYQCFFETVVSWILVAPTCPLFYGITATSQSSAWVDSSLREVTMDASFNPLVGNIVTIVTTAQVIVVSAPQTWYVTAGLFGVTGCGNYNTNREATLRCLKTA